MKKKNLIMLIGVFILLTSCSSSEEELANVTLMLDYTPNTNHTGIYVARDMGYYADNGLEVEIMDNATSSTTQAVSKGIVDFGISYEENLTLAQNEGMNNLESIYAILKENTSGFMSYRDKNITEPSDFKGKTYCGWGSEVEEAIVKAVAQSYEVGEDEFDIALTQTDFLRSSESDCDFFWEYTGWAGVEAKVKNIDYNYIPLLDLGYNFYSPVIITTDEYIKENEEIVQSFVSATIKGYEYAAQNPDEAAQIFLDNNPSYDKELILNSQKYLSDYYIADNGKAGYQKDEVWKDFTNFLYDSKIVDTKEYEELYTNEYVDNYYKS